MLHPETIFVAVEQAWLEPGSLKSCGGHHLEPQGSRAYSSAVLRVNPFSRQTYSATVRDAVRERPASPSSAIPIVRS